MPTASNNSVSDTIYEQFWSHPPPPTQAQPDSHMRP